ncbi:hypothetical protein JCM10908_001828 [Rhodotorula pacifica]|uniref:chromatin structure-remodeling complex subunit RSC7 n=1 Tax=Rhodotorula pacifica TaxID=1495444 RepID=UPI003170A17A
MPASDSEGSLYEPEQSPPIKAPSAASRLQPSRSARDFSSSALDFSSSTGAPSYTDSAGPSALPTGANTSAVGTPAGSETGQDDGDDSAAMLTTAEATPDPQPQPVKRSKALNFLKKKEPKTSVTIKGTTYQIRDEEIVMPDDPRGEAKIDAYGNLLGGRQWKVHTFTSPLRPNPNKVYILSIDAARAAGFRDSLYFFRRNPMIHKLTCVQEEKDRLIELGRLSGNLKSRAVTMVSARNTFKVMGATFVQDGKYVVDDYYEEKSIADGHKPGEPAFIEAYDPDKDTGTLATSKGNAPPGATTLGLNHLIGHPGKPKVPGAELLTGTIAGNLPTFGGVGTLPFGRAWDPVARKAKPAAHLSWESWMLQYAQITREENAKFIGIRRGNVGQVQVGLNVEENEEDCYEWVEEEYSDHEEEEAAAAAAATEGNLSSAVKSEPTPAPSIPPPTPGPTTTDMQLDSSGAATPSLAPDFGAGLPALPPLASTSGAAIPSPLSAAHLPTTAAAAPSPATAAAAVATPPPPRPKKRRMVRSYIPIRGLYDPETNVPHVYRATQAREVLAFERVSKLPRIDSDAGGDAHDDVDSGGDTRADRLRAAAKAGVASVEVVSDPRAWALETGGRTIDDALEGRRGREDVLLPGMWDFLELAKA